MPSSKDKQTNEIIGKAEIVSYYIFIGPMLSGPDRCMNGLDPIHFDGTLGHCNRRK